MMCRLLGVSRHGECNKDHDLFRHIEEIFEESYRTYGTRRIKKALDNTCGWIVSRRRIARAMKKLGLRAKTKRRLRITTTHSRHTLSISPNLLDQNFDASAPNEVYAGDITYIKTKEGWLYLAVVIDLYARAVVGWAIADHMQTSLISDALIKADRKRGSFAPDAIFHSDRGSQYASQEYRTLLHTFKMRQSMSGKGNGYDNAVSESFFGTMKTELLYPTKFQTKKEAINTITHYIGFYNTKRLHSYNGYLSPLEMELKWWQAYFRKSA